MVHLSLIFTCRVCSRGSKEPKKTQMQLALDNRRKNGASNLNLMLRKVIIHVSSGETKTAKSS